MNNENIKEMDKQSLKDLATDLAYEIESIGKILEVDAVDPEEHGVIEAWWKDADCNIISNIARTIQRLVKHQRQVLEFL